MTWGDGRVGFRPLRIDDFPQLVAWINTPHVAEWWDSPTTLDALTADYTPSVKGLDGTHPFLVLLDDRPIGFIQSYVAMGSGGGWWTAETDPGVRGIDQFIGEPALIGQGIGTAMVRKFVAQLLADPAVTRVQVDPHPANRRAIRCYEKAGFRAVGSIVTPDGPALLMHAERSGADD